MLIVAREGQQQHVVALGIASEVVAEPQVAAHEVLAVVFGATGFSPLIAFFLAGFAAGSALRQLALATRRQGYRGLLGRANGGMVVHLGVILVAVGLAASNSYTRSTEVTLKKGESIEFAGHTFTLRDVTDFKNDRSVGIKAVVSIERGAVQEEAWL